MAGGGVFGILGDLPIGVGTVTFVLVILLLVVIEVVLQAIDKHVRDSAYREMVEKVYREMMLLGIISFSVFLTTELGDPDVEYLHAFEFAHITLFFLGVFFVCQAACLMFLGLHIKSVWDRAAARSLDKVISESKPMRDSWSFHCSWLPLSSFREVMEMKIVEVLFKDAFALPASFDFAAYMRFSLDRHILELIDVDKSSWLLLCILIGLNYVRVEYMDSFGSDCGGVGSDGHYADDDHADDDHRRLAGGGESVTEAHPGCHLRFFVFWGFVLDFLTLVLLFVSRLYERRLLRQAGVYDTHEYEHFLTMIEAHEVDRLRELIAEGHHKDPTELSLTELGERAAIASKAESEGERRMSDTFTNKAGQFIKSVLRRSGMTNGRSSPSRRSVIPQMTNDEEAQQAGSGADASAGRPRSQTDPEAGTKRVPQLGGRGSVMETGGRNMHARQSLTDWHVQKRRGSVTTAGTNVSVAAREAAARATAAAFNAETDGKPTADSKGKDSDKDKDDGSRGATHTSTPGFRLPVARRSTNHHGGSALGRLARAARLFQSQDHLQDIFILDSPMLYFKIIDYIVLLNNLYMALWATSFITIATYSSSEYMWQIVMLVPEVLILTVMCQIVKTSTVIKAISKLEPDLVGRVVEESQDATFAMQELRSRVLAQAVYAGGMSNLAEWVARLFQEMDADASGYIDSMELRALLRQLSIHFSHTRFKVLFRAIDHNRDGSLSLKELNRLLFPDQAEKEDVAGRLANAENQEREQHASNFEEKIRERDPAFGLRAVRAKSSARTGSSSSRPRAKSSGSSAGSSIKEEDTGAPSTVPSEEVKSSEEGDTLLGAT